LATVQLVLQADWQEVWHSPQALPSEGIRIEEVAIVFTWVMFGLLLFFGFSSRKSA